MAKPGRNDPCPCGSGNKYKKCCLAKEEAVAREQLVKAQAPRDTLRRDQRAAADRLQVTELTAAVAARLARAEEEDAYEDRRVSCRSPPSFRLAPPAWRGARPSLAQSVLWRGLQAWRAPRQASPTALPGAPIPPGSTCHPTHQPDLRLPPAPAVQPLRPSTGPRSCRHVHRTARCAGWHWRGSWCRPVPPCQA